MSDVYVYIETEKHIPAQHADSVSLPVISVQSCLPGPILTVSVMDRSFGGLPLSFISDTLLLLYLQASEGKTGKT